MMKKQPSIVVLWWKTWIILQCIGTASAAFTVSSTYRNKPGFARTTGKQSALLFHSTAPRVGAASFFALGVASSDAAMSSSLAESSNAEELKTVPPPTAAAGENPRLISPVATVIEELSVAASTVESPSKTEETMEKNKLLVRIQRRLDTAEDKFDVHKISSAVYVLSSTFMFGTGISNGFGEIPDYLLIPTWLFLLSSWVQGISSFEMTHKYRGNDPVVQGGFMNMAVVLLSSSWGVLYFSPFAPDAFDSFLIGNTVLGWSFMPNMVRGMEEVVNISSMMDNRKLRTKEKGNDLGNTGDFFSYFIGAVLNFSLGTFGFFFFLDPAHDRSWMLDAANKPWIVSDKPGLIDAFVAHNYYNFLAISFNSAYGALAVTLRDKKLVSKSMEQLVIAIANAMVIGTTALSVGLL